jgi:Ser/Thr protein kinase RdoA (MazF antagonist)
VAVTSEPQPPQPVIEQYDLDPESIRRIDIGLINRSFSVRRQSGDEAVLQRVNPMFPASVNDDIDAVTKHLWSKSLPTPLLIPSKAGSRCVAYADETWRLLTRIPGETHESLSTDADAAEAGRVLGAFHQALADFDEPLRGGRPAVHNVERHLNNLRAALLAHTIHPALPAVQAISDAVLDLAQPLGPLPRVPDRLVHGDPKISNVIFEHGRAICLIDLDTIARTPVALELGDALRSWCNPAGEDSLQAQFSAGRFEAALQGYRLGAPDFLATSEWQSVPEATLSIALELAARFAADALNESYFGWDSTRFSGASEHNLVRARAQLMLAKDIAAQLPTLHGIAMTFV